MATPSQPDPRPEEETVRYVIEDQVAWVYFNRPDKRNCMSPKLNRQMKRVIEELEFRDDVAVLVLTGEGAAWSAGMDLLEYFRMNEDKRSEEHTSELQSLMRISYAVFCLKKKKKNRLTHTIKY